MPQDAVHEIAVVVPAHDEQDRVEACVRSIARAARVVARAAGVRTRIILAADRCADATADRARALGATVLDVDLGTVGAARRAGAAVAVERLAVPPPRAWLACTDADTVVPPRWLLAFVEAGARGEDARVGAVELPSRTSPPLLATWTQDYRSDPGGPGHRHVHGANLGVCAETYLAAGGFDPVAVHEDVRLVERLVADGRRVAWRSDDPVTTSARTHGSVPGGFGDHLRGLVAAAGREEPA